MRAIRLWGFRRYKEVNFGELTCVTLQRRQTVMNFQDGFGLNRPIDRTEGGPCEDKSQNGKHGVDCRFHEMTSEFEYVGDRLGGRQFTLSSGGIEDNLNGLVVPSLAMSGGNFFLI